ncbi:DUF167 domain-containing protein [Thermodesulforhabdus norvegica]|nr:DUF167 family protein [Thermodesulforhabdus norvegica]
MRVEVPSYVTLQNDSIIVDVTVQPKASRDEIAGVHNNRLKVRVTAPPVEGAANRSCIELMASYLGIPKRDVSIVSGASGRNKRIRIRTSNPDALISKLPRK